MNPVITAKVDPDAARAYWTMGRVDSERAFRRARRHSRIVRVLRMFIPASIAATFVAIVLITYLNPMRMLSAVPANLDNLVVSGTKVTMEKPRLTGFTQDQRAYEFTAEAAAQDLTKPDFVELRNIRARIEMEDKSTMQMTALGGLYDTKKEILRLQNDILLSSTSGYKGYLSEAVVDVRKGNVVSDKPVELEMLQGILNAKRLEIVDSGDVIRFENGVSMTLMLNGAPLVKEKIQKK